MSTKINLGKKQRQSDFGGNGVGFFGLSSQGVSLEVDEMISNQVAPIREVNVMPLFPNIKKNNCFSAYTQSDLNIFIDISIHSWKLFQ